MNSNLNFEFGPVWYRPKPEPGRTGLTGNRSNQTGSHWFGEPCLQHAVKKWAFAEKKPFKVVISNPSTYDVKCLSPGCPWRVHGYLPKGESNFVASIVVRHLCKLSGIVLMHKNMTAKFVANVMYEEIVKRTSMSPFQIMLVVSNRFTYEMAWRAKQKALEWRLGTYKNSHHHLPQLLALL